MIHWARKIEFVTRKRKSQRIFSLGLTTILAVIKWIPGCTIFHFTEPVGWTKLMKAEFSETRSNRICQTGTTEQFAFQMQHGLWNLKKKSTTLGYVSKILDSELWR